MGSGEWEASRREPGTTIWPAAADAAASVAAGQIVSGGVARYPGVIRRATHTTVLMSRFSEAFQGFPTRPQIWVPHHFLVARPQQAALTSIEVTELTAVPARLRLVPEPMVEQRSVKFAPV
ncbi:hypothetical protein GCM10022223_60330 [Kineosporia mesophila]|uniref:EVE domain-containing protein n=1 Tax=Kineosporia mesophila TaxID=566012 RepID=A0ABP7AK43_9ACTN